MMVTLYNVLILCFENRNHQDIRIFVSCFGHYTAVQLYRYIEQPGMVLVKMLEF